jgi:hypothetical protein
MIIHRTKPTDKLQFQTFSPAIPHFKPCKYNPRNKNVSMLGCACILAAHPFLASQQPQRLVTLMLWSNATSLILFSGIWTL